jgi:prepilin signal peptidase PulO-like enzyme (type II secretory pathway)
MVPILSYILLRGLCRRCGAHIPVRVILEEAVTGALFLFAFWRYGLSFQFALTVF